jgi:hypothetical protein
MQASRFLKDTFQLDGKALRYASYLFVTYAIEVRADELYPVYQDALDKAKSRVMVKSIILEEEGHLEEMIQQLERFHADWENYAGEVLKIENELFQDWINAVGRKYYHMNQPQHWYKALAGRQEIGNYRNLRINEEGVDFLSNDYLGMTGNKAFQQHLLKLLDADPELLSGATGSRLISGNSSICTEVEEVYCQKASNRKCFIISFRI